MIEITAHLLPSKIEATSDFSLSVSKAKTFEDCKAKYKYAYIDKLPQKEWDFLIFGKFLHFALEKFHEILLQNKNKNNIHVIMKTAFSQAREKYNDKITKTQIKEAFDILNYYLFDYAEKIKKNECPKILSLEKPFYIDIHKNKEPIVLLNGFIDLVQIDPDGVLHVADYKTTKDKKYLKDFFQLLTYAFVLMTENEAIEKIRASFILLRHKFSYITKEYTRNDVLDIKNKYIEYAETIHQEKLWRPSPTFLCKYCSFLSHCEGGQRYLQKRNIKPNVSKETEFVFGKGSW